MNTILRRRGLGYETTKLIAQKLRENFNQNINVTLNENINGNFDTVIRWGCTSTIRNKHIINQARHIYTISDKVQFRKLMQDNNISVPKTFFSKESVRNSDLLGNILLLGREANHHQGRNIAEINNLNDLLYDNRSAYWNEYIKKEHEYRIYTFFGKVIKVDEKVPKEGKENEIAWNHAQGNSSFVNVKWGNWPIKACTEALKCANLIGIHFSGVDIITKDNNCYILEANTAPTMTGNYDTNLYAEAFNWMLNIINETGKIPKLFETPLNATNWKELIHPIKL